MKEKSLIARKHHYIPQMLQRNFADKKGMLCFARSGRQMVHGITGTKNLFVEKDLYTITNEDGSPNDIIETKYSEIETVGADFFKTIINSVRSNASIRLTNSAWRTLWFIYYMQLKRHPELSAHYHNEKVDEIVARLVDEIPETVQLIEDPVERKRLIDVAIAKARLAQPGKMIADVFERLGLALYRVSQSEHTGLVLGSCGVSIARIGGRPELDGDVAFLPLAPDLAMGPFSEPRSIVIFDVDRGQVRRMNEAIARRSHTIAGRSAEQLASLEKFLRPAFSTSTHST